MNCLLLTTWGRDMALDAPLSWAAVAALALAAGFPPGPAVIITSITEPESARIQNNVQQGQPYATTGWGLTQITPGNSEPQFGTDQAMLNGLNNMRAAHAKWSAAGGFDPWTTWVNGLNVPYLADAKAAVERVSKLSPAQLNKLVDAAQAGAGSATWAPDAAMQHADDMLKRLLKTFDTQLINQRMVLQRVGVPGWQP